MLSRPPSLERERPAPSAPRALDAAVASRPSLSLVRDWAEAPPDAGASRRVKRVVDVVGAGVLLAALTPVMALVAATIRLTSRGPAIFVQPRIGRHGDDFRMYKFRTMVAGAERQEPHLAKALPGTFFKLDVDPRVTRVGRVLRRTSLDELPQLWNVLLGDMSLVGPRPLLRTDMERFPEGAAALRFSVLPGLTGLWQVSGRSSLPDAERLRLDREYVQGWSLALDAKILAKTLPAVLSSRGAW